MKKLTQQIYPHILCILFLIIFRFPIRMVLENSVISNLSLLDIFYAINNYPGTKFTTFLVVLLLFFKNYDRIVKEKTLLSNRIIYETYIYIAIYIILPKFLNTLNILSLVGIELCVIELLLFIYKLSYQHISQQQNNNSTPFACDIPTEEDKFNREHYAKVLLNKILETKKNVNPQKAFTIFLNEKYGYGKTSFFLQLKNVIDKERKNEFIYIEYNPWLCENEDSMAKEFFTILRNELSFYDTRLSKSFKDYIYKLGIVDVKWVNLFLSDNDSIWNKGQKLCKYIVEIEKPVLVFIDDVDRLNKNELLNLFKIIRNTANFGNVYYIVACDQSYVEQQLLTAGINDPQRYLKKFVNFEFLLPANDNAIKTIIENDLTSLCEHIGLQKSEIDSVLRRTVALKDFVRSFSDIRDWKRSLNIISFNIDVQLYGQTLEEIYLLDLIHLSILQSINIEVYKTLREDDSVILTVSGSDYTRLTLKPILGSYCSTLNLGDLDKGDIDDTNIKSISEYITEEDYNKEKQTSYILYRLFGDKYNWIDKRSINYIDSYFKYFSGKHRKNEIPMAAVKSLLDIEISDTFKTKLKSYIEKYPNSLYHKLRHATELDYKSKEKRIELFRKIVLYLELLLSDKNRN